MGVVLSNGVDLADISRAELAALMVQIKNSMPPARAAKSDDAQCVVSPHTGACTRCGAAGAVRCDPQAAQIFVPSTALREWMRDACTPPVQRAAHPVPTVECSIDADRCVHHGTRKFVEYLRTNGYMPVAECAL